MDKSQLFFCYDIRLMEHLSRNGIKYLMKAIHPDTLKLFFVYGKSDKLQQNINEFNKQPIKKSPYRDKGNR